MKKGIIPEEAGKVQCFLEGGVTEFPWDIQNTRWGLGACSQGRAVRPEVILGANLRLGPPHSTTARWGMHLLFGSQILRVKTNIWC